MFVYKTVSRAYKEKTSLYKPLAVCRVTRLSYDLLWCVERCSDCWWREPWLLWLTLGARNHWRQCKVGGVWVWWLKECIFFYTVGKVLNNELEDILGMVKWTWNVQLIITPVPPPHTVRTCFVRSKTTPEDKVPPDTDYPLNSHYTLHIDGYIRLPPFVYWRSIHSDSVYGRECS